MCFSSDGFLWYFFCLFANGGDMTLRRYISDTNHRNDVVELESITWTHINQYGREYSTVNNHG